jgi:hypothetical protein
MDGGATAGSLAKHSSTIRFRSSPGKASSGEAMTIGTVVCGIVVVVVGKMLMEGRESNVCAMGAGGLYSCSET